MVQPLFAGAALALMVCSPTTAADAQKSQQQILTPTSKGYAAAAGGLQVYYEIYGKGEPIVVLVGGFGDASSMVQTIRPLSRERQVIGIESRGTRPHGGDAAIRMAIQHPEMVRNLIVISTAAERDGWYPEALKGMEAVSPSQFEQFKQTPLYKRYADVAPQPEQFPVVLDRMGDLMKKDYDWRAEIAKLRVPTLLLFADHDAVSMKHIAEFFALFEGGVRDAGSSRVISTNPHRRRHSSSRAEARRTGTRLLRSAFHARD